MVLLGPEKEYDRVYKRGIIGVMKKKGGSNSVCEDTSGYLQRSYNKCKKCMRGN